MNVFVDTSVWFAAVNQSDARNGRAKEILGSAASLVTSNLVLAETWRLLHQKVHFEAAEGFWRAIRRGAAQLEMVVPADIEAAWLIGERFPDQEFSLTDRTSFTLMERLRIDIAASFDDHFAIYRFGRGRTEAFDVLR
jgi:predicted nucleic acid-binding protein